MENDKDNDNEKKPEGFNLEEAIKIPPLTNLLDAGITQEIDEKEKERAVKGNDRFPLSPSQLGGCSRKLAIELAEFVGAKIYPKIKDDPRSTRRFKRGYDIEYSMLKQLDRYVPIQQSYKQQHIEMTRTPDGKHTIGGSVDVVLVDENEAIIVDIKSKATYFSASHIDDFEETFGKIAEMEGVHTFGDKAYFIEDIYDFYKRYPNDNFISRYFVQLNTYGASPWARSFKHNGFPNVNGISCVSLLFENKNNHVIAEIRWKPSQKLYEETLQRALDIYKYVVEDKKEASNYPAEYSLGTVNCRLCNRRETCWADSRHPYNGPKKEWPKDIERLEGAEELEEKYEEFKKALTAVEQFEIIENKLKARLASTGETKFKFKDGHVYELKRLKSPKPHIDLRRSK